MITLKKLFSLSEFKTIHLVAGKQGLIRPVTGVNVLESEHLADFLKPCELLVMTGVNMHGDEERLIDMVQTAFKRKAAGIILNVGPYIPSIPERVYQFADDKGFPVFEMPWVYRIADFVKITIQYLATVSKMQIKQEDVFSQLLFHPDMIHEQQLSHILVRLGMTAEDDVCIVVCAVHDSTILPWLEYVAREELSKKYRIHLVMVHRNQIIYLAEYKELHDSDLTLSKLIAKIRNQSNGEFEEAAVSIGSGDDHPITQVSTSYHEALKVIRLAERRPDLKINDYKNIGAYKLIMNIADHDVIETYHHDFLEILYRYDKLHKTDYVDFLRVFLQEDGRTSKIADKEFIHRNTVLYKIKKIESILDMDLSSPFVKNNLSMAFMIEDITE